MKITSIILLLLIFSCSTDKNSKEYPIDTLTRENSPITQLTPKVFYEYNEDEEFNLEYVYVYNDSIWIKQYNFNPESKNIIVFCNLKDSSQNRGYLTYGKGNMEMLGGFSFFNNNYITVVGNPSAYLFNIDSAFNKNYIPDIIKSPMILTNIVVLKNKDIIYSNQYFFDYHSVNVSCNKGAKRIIKLEKGTNYAVETIRYEDFTIGGMSSIAANEDKNRIISANKYFPEITIMDTLFNIKRVLLGPDKFDVVVGKNEKGGLSLSKNVFSYLNVCTTNDYVYLGYEGSLYCGHGKDNPDTKQVYEIIKMDWDGNIKHIYKLDNKLYSISVIDDKELYGTNFIKGKSTFVKCEL